MVLRRAAEHARMYHWLISCLPEVARPEIMGWQDRAVGYDVYVMLSDVGLDLRTLKTSLV